LIMLSTMILFNLVHSVLPLVLIRGLQGVGMAFVTTAVLTFVANMAPPNRRGEAMSFNAAFTGVAQAFAPPLGILLIVGSNHSPVFLAGAAIDIVGLFFAVMLSEKRQAKSRPVVLVARSGYQLVSREALMPGLVYFFHAISIGAIFSFMSVFAVSKGIQNPGLFFTTYAGVMILLRATTGKLSDRYGRTAILVPGMTFTAVSMVVLALSSSLIMLLIAALLFGMGMAWVQPTIQALVIDRLGAKGAGSAMATIQSALDLGYIVGSVVLGLILQFTTFTTIFIGVGAAVLLGLVVYFLGVYGRTYSVDQVS